MQSEPSVQELFGENPYNALVAEIRDFAIFLTDSEGRIVSWNEGARLLFGYDNDEIIGQLAHVLFVPEDCEAGIPQQELDTARAEGRAEDVRWHLRKDGSRFWANGVVTVLRDDKGELRGFAKIARDDTARHNSEDELRTSKERFDLVATATNDAIWDWDLTNDTVWWNENVKTLFGYPLAEVDSSPDWWKERVHPDDREEVVHSIHDTIDGGGQTWTSEYRFLCADGNYAPVFDRGYVQRNEAGVPQRILGTMMDLTVQKRLAEERKIFERLADNSPDFIGICNLEGQSIYLNDAALNLVGLGELEEAKRVPVAEFFFPEDRDFVLNDFFPNVIRQGQGATEIRFRHFQTGAAIWMVYVVFVVRDADGKTAALATVSRDITAKRQSEAEREELLRHLEFERARLATVFQKVPAFVAIYRGANFVYEVVNPAYYQVVGHRELIGKPVLEAIPEIMGQGYIELLTGVFTTGQPYEGREVMVRLQREPNGPLEERFLNLLYQPLREPDGTISGVFSHGVDITEQVRARRVVEEARAEAEALRLQAEEANRLKDEFLATLSHELRTPLNAILGWSNLIQTGQLEPEDAQRGLATIERNARAQAQLIEDILDVSRMITGKMRLDVQSVDLARIIEEAINTALPATQAKDIRLQRVLDAGATTVAGDPARLQQIVWNLLSNAIKFTPKGGRVQIRLERVSSHIEIMVSDSGQGIAPHILPHIFDRFRQADSSSTRSHGGLGLGLAIVRHLAELHGGSIEAYSEGLGKGSVFTLKLPLVAVRQQTREERRSHPTTDRPIEGELPHLDGLHVLVVDDQEDTRIFLTVVLAKCGARVTAVASASEAFETLLELRPDVLLSDIGMPDEDGYSLIRRIRALPPEQGGHTPATALTAFARAEDRIKALRSGFQSHIPKPVEPLELVTVIANLAGRHG
ncbi:PAS domain S-box protein [bacterium]|nr:MAG: PAS domain S-box protein [bacterium]